MCTCQAKLPAFQAAGVFGKMAENCARADVTGVWTTLGQSDGRKLRHDDCTHPSSAFVTMNTAQPIRFASKMSRCATQLRCCSSRFKFCVSACIPSAFSQLLGRIVSSLRGAVRRRGARGAG